MDDFDSASIFNFERQGSFGVFKTEWSFPLDYYLLSFKPEEIKYLTLAKDLKPSKNLNFDMLLQRDIDERRIEEDLKPYVAGIQNLKKDDAAEGAIFFPPLLAAIVPVQDNDILDFYNDQLPHKEENGQLVLEWESHFRSTYKTESSVDAISITSFNSAKGDFQNYRVKRNPARFQARLTDEAGSGVRLVVVDGQHRLVTLKSLYKANPQLMKDMSFPVCVVYAPQCTAALSAYNEAKEPHEIIPKIHEVFRKLFLDVNQTAERVSGHFEYLLSDVDSSAIACRQYCKHLLEKDPRSKEALAQVEWNVRNYKEAKNITRDYSITSIGVIAPSLTDYLSPHYEYLLNLDEVSSELYDSDDEERRLSFQQLTLRQKPIIERQIRQNLVPLLHAIFSRPKAFSNLSDIFSKLIKKLKEEADKTGKSADAAHDVLEHLLEYANLHKEDNRAGFNRKSDFEQEFRKAIGIEDTEERPIQTRAIFQKAMFEALGEFIKKTKRWNTSIDKLATAYCFLLDEALKNDGEIFIPERVYLSYVVYTQRRLNVNAEARKTLSRLVLANLRSDHVAAGIVNRLGLEGQEAQLAESELAQFGLANSKKIIEVFDLRRRAAFVKLFNTDLSLPLEDRQALQAALEIKNRDVQKAQKGEIDTSKISKRFDEMVDERIYADLKEARDQLKNFLDLDVEIVADPASGTDQELNE
ncbi:hypothetical protein ABIC33_004220 [Variovorax sp. 1140]|uniref:hypothetical protein n=1 Tax=Variovorax atrisoli TaxID=3394203 RepID=UPI00339257B7